jgi:two-component system osmolarity sensor histidine kinase EnvZ
MDYARPVQSQLETVDLNEIIQAALYTVSDSKDLHVNVRIPTHLAVKADKVELLRAITNLLENARRYGKSPGTAIATVDIEAKTSGPWVQLKILDHGSGVPEKSLRKLTRPFYRGDAARTSATGAGLGLAIAEKTIVSMGGIFSLANADTGGLAAHIKLRQG